MTESLRILTALARLSARLWNFDCALATTSRHSNPMSDWTCGRESPSNHRGDRHQSGGQTHGSSCRCFVFDDFVCCVVDVQDVCSSCPHTACWRLGLDLCVPTITLRLNTVPFSSCVRLATDVPTLTQCLVLKTPSCAFVPADGAGDFDGQNSGHDYWGTLWLPPTGFVNNCDGGRAHSYCDYRQQ